METRYLYLIQMQTCHDQYFIGEQIGWCQIRACIKQIVFFMGKVGTYGKDVDQTEIFKIHLLHKQTELGNPISLIFAPPFPIQHNMPPYVGLDLIFLTLGQNEVAWQWGTIILKC